MTLAEITEVIDKAVLNKFAVANIKDTEITGFTLVDEHPLPDIHVRFHRVSFMGNLAFDHVIFPKGASFIDVDFYGETTFTFARFDGPAYFWKCRFHKLADFFRAATTKLNYPNSRRCPGEANFSYCEFYQDALFKRIVFTGPAYFHRTVFKRNANFHEARFEDGVTFDSTLTDVCVAAGELPSETVGELLKRGLIVKSGDRKEGYYNFDLQIDSVIDLQDKLSLTPERLRRRVVFGRFRSRVRSTEQPTFTDAQKDQVITKWKQYTIQAMFSWEHKADFTCCFFGPSARFRHLSLRTCLLKGTNLATAEFDDVTWDDRPVFSWPVRVPVPWTVREKIFDELELLSTIRSRRIFDGSKSETQRTRNSRLSISAAYHELKTIYEKRGERERARHFYYGEMEMARLALPIWRRFSLASVYKWASGYGTQEGKGAFILIAIVLLIFPFIYHRLDKRWGLDSHKSTKQELAYVELESLEASTFLKASSSTSEKRNDYQLVIESVERVSVTIQAALLILAIKSRFQRID